MDVKYLNYIITIAERQNMTKAAEELYVSQSSLSQYLSKLEQEIGVPLFERTRGRLVLTPAGERYVQAARQVIEIQKALYHDIRSMQNKSHITIGTTSQLGLRMLTDVVPRFKDRFPASTLEITEANVPNLTRLLQEESLDCAVMALNNTASFSREQVNVLGTEEIFLALHRDHPYCKKNPAGTISRKALVTEFKNEPFLLCKKGSTIREATNQVFEGVGFTPNTICETNSVLTTRAMAAKGIGITFIGRSCITESEPLCCYHLDPILTRQFALVHRKNWSMHSAEKALCAEIRAYFDRPEIRQLLLSD